VPRKATPLEKALKVRFKDQGLLRSALTHRSFAFENELPQHMTNERLEFLGDAVLGIVVTDIAYKKFEKLSEGQLAKLRAATVNMATLADVARGLNLGQEVLLGKGEEMSGGREKASILADALEALLGAIYLDRGIDAVSSLIYRLFWPRMEDYMDGGGDRDYKTTLQELSAQDLGRLPEYRVRERGPDHQKEFTATVFLAGREFGMGVGRSKKEAEQRAAREAHTRLVEERDPVPDSDGERPR
jgi:ribonuclease-3